MLSPKQSVEPVELSIPTTSVVLPRRLGLSVVVPPEAHSGPDGFPGEKSRLRSDAAALRGNLRPRRGSGVFARERRRGGRHGQRWPGATKAGPEIPSPTSGASEGFPGLRF